MTTKGRAKSVPSASPENTIKSAKRQVLARRKKEVPKDLSDSLPQSSGDIHGSMMRNILRRRKTAKGNKTRLAQLLMADLRKQDLLSTLDEHHLQSILRNAADPNVELDQATDLIKSTYRQMLDADAGRPALALASLAVNSVETAQEVPAARINWRNVFVNDFLGGCMGGLVGSIWGPAGAVIGLVAGGVGASGVTLLDQPQRST